MAAVHDQRSLVRAVRGPLLLFAIAILGIVAAFVLDETSVRE